MSWIHSICWWEKVVSGEVWEAMHWGWKGHDITEALDDILEWGLSICHALSHKRNSLLSDISHWASELFAIVYLLSPTNSFIKSQRQRYWLKINPKNVYKNTLKQCHIQRLKCWKKFYIYNTKQYSGTILIMRKYLHLNIKQ
jgi:hypothetical protein